VDIYGIPGNANYAGLLGEGRIDAYAAIAATPYEPTAQFMTPVTTILPGTSIQFHDMSTGVPNTYSWEFQGGSPTLSSQPEPTVTYATAGVYTVYMTVTNAFGTDTETKTGYITVTSSPAPWVAFSSSDDYTCNKGTLTFTDESLYSPNSWNWSFEPATVTFINGTSASAQNPEVQFNEPGFYSVTLAAGNANGNSSSTMENMIFVEGLVMEYTEDFESGAVNGLVLSMNSRAKAAVDTRAAAPGSAYGLHFQGSPTTGGWSGGPMNTTPEQAWVTNVNFHSWAANCSVDATGIDGVGLTFDLRQTYSIGPKYSWFRVLVNGEQVADVYDVENYNPVTNTDPFDAKTFALDEYGNSLFSITFQASCYLSDKFFAEGDNVFLDNIAITNTTKVKENGINAAGVLTYPNPVTGTLNFSAHGLGRDVEMKILSVQGQEVAATALDGYRDGDARSIDLSNLQSGIYVLRLAGDQGVATKKFIVR
jgi:PKD repeat protein